MMSNKLSLFYSLLLAKKTNTLWVTRSVLAHRIHTEDLDLVDVDETQRFIKVACGKRLLLEGIDYAENDDPRCKLCSKAKRVWRYGKNA